VVRQLHAIGYDGEIWPVIPARDRGGDSGLSLVADLPAAPDAAFLGVNRHIAIELIAALASRGAGGAVVYASDSLNPATAARSSRRG